MSQTIDNRIVEMQFENKQFESGVQESLSTLDKLKAALRFDDASKNLDAFGKNISKNMDLSGLTKSVEGLNDRFSASGIAGMEAIRKLTDFAIEAGKTIVHALDAPFAQIREGGWKRAMNIEDAKFQLRGLEVAWETVAGDIDYAVADTAYGLDVAAKACAQLSASSVQAGDDMKAALRGISGVAAMGNTEYENISRIFTKAAGNGKVMAMELNQISQYGLNARASLRDFFNNIVEGNDKVKDIPEDLQKKVKALTKGMKVSESDINEFVHDSEIDFRTFSYAMDTAFGEHAKKANETFFGALSNIKAALSKIGAEFATPIIKGAIPIFNEIRVFLNDLRKQMGPVFAVFRNLTEFISGRVTQKLEQFRHAFLDLGGVTHIGNALKNVFTSVLKIIDAVKSAFDAVFPKTGSFVGAIVDATKGIDNFSKHLVISDQAAYAFRNIMVVVFNIIKALGSAIKSILPLIGKIANVALNIVSVITKVIACIMQLVSKLDIVQIAMTGIEKAGGLFAYALERIKNAFYYLKDVLSDTSTITGQVFAKIKDSAIMVTYIVGGSLYLAFVKLKELFSYFNTHDPLGSLIKGAKSLIETFKNLPIFNAVISGIQKTFSIFALAISNVVNLVKDFINNLKSGMSVAHAIGNTLSSIVTSVIGLIGNLIEKITSLFSFFRKDRIIEEEVIMPINGASNALVGVEKVLTKTSGSVDKTSSAFEKGKNAVSNFGSAIIDKIRTIKAGQVLLFAFGTTITILAANLVKLTQSFTKLTGSVTNAVNGIGYFFRNIGQKKTSFSEAMVAISIAIGTLTASLWALSKIETRKLIEVAGVLEVLLLTMGTFSILGKNGAGPFASAMISFSGGILILVSALYALDQVNMENIGKKWATLAIISGIVLTVSVILSKAAPQLSKGGLGILAFSGAVYVLAKALDIISHADLNNIKENWIELSAVIIAFAAFASLVSNVGIAAALGIIGFISVLKLLGKFTNTIKTNFSNIQDTLEMVANTLKGAIKYLYDGLKIAAEDMKENEMLAKLMAGSATIVIASLLGFILAIGHAGKGIKKAAVGFAIILAAISGVMYVMAKVSEMIKSINDPAAVKIATDILYSLLIFIGALSTIATIRDKIKIEDGVNTLKDVRKLMTSLAILLLSIGGLAAMVGTLSEEEFKRTERMIIETEVIIGVIATFCTLITAVASKAGKSEVSFTTFAGIVLLLGGLLGSIAVLMFMFSQVDWEKDKQQLITAGIAFGGMIVSIIGIMGMLAILANQSSKEGAGKAIAILLSFVGVIGAIAGVIYALNSQINSKEELIRAGAIAGGLIAFLVVITTLITVLEKTSVKLLNTDDKKEAFNKTFNALLAMLGAVAVFCIGLYALRNVNAGRIWGQVTAIITALTAISALVLGLQYFSKQTKFSITKKSQTNLIKSLIMIAAFIIAFKSIAKTFKGLSNVDAGRMAGQAAIIVGALVALTALAEGILYLVKKMKTGWNDLAKAGAMLTTMVGLFAILSLIFKYIISDIPDPVGMIAKSQIIMLALYELAGLVAIVGVIAKLGAKIAGGEIALAAMIGLFALLTQVFKVIDGLQTEGILAKSQTIILVMTELIALIEVMGLLMEYTSGAFVLGAIAELVLWPMIKLFDLLSNVFVKINGLKTEGIMAKSQTIILVMTELIALIGVMGGLMYAAGEFALGGLAELALWPMILLFGLLADVFVKIDGMKTEGLLAKSQAIILVMTELVGIIALMGGLVYAAGEFALGGLAELALWPMILLFGLLADVFVKINEMKTEGLLAKSQAIVLVMTELVGIIAVMGIIVPLMAFGGLSELALAPMIGLFGQLSEVFMIIDKMHLEGLREKADIIVATLLKLEGLSALGGIIGGTVGGGLLLLAQGIQALGSACASVGAGIMVFGQSIDALAVSIQHLTATGPMISAWCANVSAGILTMSKSVVAAIKGLITGVASALVSGGAIVFAAAATLGRKLLEGFNSVVKPFVWGKELVGNFAKGILSGVSAIANAALTVAKTVWSYLHFSDGSEVGPLSGNSVFTWGAHGGQNYANGWNSAKGTVANVVNGIGSTITNGLDLNLFGQGANSISSYIQGLYSGAPALESWKGWLDSLMAGGTTLTRMEQINQKIGRTATQRSQQVELSIAKEKKLSKELDSQVAILQAQEKGMRRSGKSEEYIARATENTRASVAGLSKSLKDQQDTTDKLAGLTQDTIPTIQNFGSALDDAGKKGKRAASGVKEAKDAVSEFYDKIESAISLFDKYEEAEEMSSDELLSNMASQITGIANWSTKIQQLASKGIEEGLLQKLADMGPQGEKYVNAFVKMTGEQLAQANKYYEQSLILPQHVTAQVYGSFAIAGANAKDGFVNGLQPEKIKEDGVAFAHNFLDGVQNFLGIHSPSTVMRDDVGKQIPAGMEQGITWPTVVHNLEVSCIRIANKVIDAFDDKLVDSEELITIGRNVVAGIQKGVEDKGAQNSLFDTIRSLCQRVIQTAKSPQGFWEHSPSRVFYQIGSFVTEGLAKGISDNTAMAINAIGKTSEEVIDQMRETINQANQALMDDVDAPVITPVLDLSEIQNGSRQLDSMLSRNSALSASRSFTDLQNQKWNSQSSMVQAMMDNTDVVSAIGSLSSDIASLKDAMTNIKMVLDTGTMVGAMTPAIDQQLGMRQVLAGRGI